MCNLYQPTGPEKIRLKFGVAAPVGAYGPTVAPLKPGPIVLAGQALVAQWGFIPENSASATPMLPNGTRMSTNNARAERLASAKTYRKAWALGQRCLIPADHFDEPNWSSGKNEWWRFWRADSEPWALAGIWTEWVHPLTAERIPSYAMVTQNCDGHPLLGLMHKPDPTLPAHAQDKRAVVPIEQQHWAQWLQGSRMEAHSLIQVPDAALFKAGPAQPVRQESLF